MNFHPKQIVGATEFRRNLGKYIKEADESPVLVIDKNMKKKIFISLDLFHAIKSKDKKVDLKSMLGLFGKSKIGSVALQHSVSKIWTKKYI